MARYTTSKQIVIGTDLEVLEIKNGEATAIVDEGFEGAREAFLEEIDEFFKVWDAAQAGPDNIEGAKAIKKLPKEVASLKDQLEKFREFKIKELD